MSASDDRVLHDRLALMFAPDAHRAAKLRDAAKRCRKLDGDTAQSIASHAERAAAELDAIQTDLASLLESDDE